MALTVLPCLLLLGFGCSFAAVHGPPENHAQLVAFDCTTEDTIPVEDALFGVSAAFGGTMAGFAVANGKIDNAEEVLPVAAGLGAFAVASVASIYGLTVTDECRQARLEAAERRARIEELRHQELLRALSTRDQSGPVHAGVPPTTPVTGRTHGTSPSPAPRQVRPPRQPSPTSTPHPGSPVPEPNAEQRPAQSH
ncbi:MAG: hypothetical protein OXU20_18265 [Myxococcales bacterium]|nr:hypothetical protein [Myxococcales bacterium]